MCQEKLEIGGLEIECLNLRITTVVKTSRSFPHWMEIWGVASAVDSPPIHSDDGNLDTKKLSN
jgi:hypothetical protein